MAIKMVSTNGQIQYNVDEFVVDTPDDIKKLPNRSVMGSMALCLSTSDVYVKDGKGKWVIIGGDGGSGGGGSGGGSGSDSTISYNSLTDKPSLNGDTIQGNMEIKSIPDEAIDSLFPEQG